MEQATLRFSSLAAKTMVCHTVTYVIVGMIAMNLFHYAELMSKPESGMRPITSPWVMAGPLFQPIRGLLFATVFWPLRRCLFGRRHAWLVMGWMLVGVGIIGTFAAPVGSLEAAIFTPAPILDHVMGWREVVPQALLLSALLCYWVENPGRRWLNWLLGGAFLVLMVLTALGLLVRT